MKDEFEGMMRRFASLLKHIAADNWMSGRTSGSTTTEKRLLCGAPRPTPPGTEDRDRDLAVLILFAGTVERDVGVHATPAELQQTPPVFHREVGYGRAFGPTDVLNKHLA